MTEAAGKRPRSLQEVAQRSRGISASFDHVLREFLDSFYLMETEERVIAIKNEPDPVGAIHDAYLAAVAEHLAWRFDLSSPEWTEKPSRFLHKPFFAGGLESLKATLLVESPVAFRRRMLFVSENVLSRPREIAARPIV
ncbi:MAG: hypothetical protein HY246_04765 [Proteobacteria bacterium]|nr:hypothetical protein [Pseudomonadota bacterium]